MIGIGASYTNTTIYRVYTLTEFELYFVVYTIIVALSSVMDRILEAKLYTCYTQFESEVSH
jgi:hypothetical protein